MCGKYTLLIGIIDDRMKMIVEICNNCTSKSCDIILRENGEICPNDAAPALMVDRRKVTAIPMRWGLQSPVGSKLIINARGETVKERKMFSQLIRRQRCAMPSAGYFEWRDEDNVRHQISRQNGEAFYLAGLYRYDESGVPRFVVLTREAYGEHARIHSRMPCLLHSKEEARRWISGEIGIEELCTRMDEDLMVEVQGVEQLKMDLDD